MNTYEQQIMAYAASGCIFGVSELIGALEGNAISRPVVNTILARLTKTGKLTRVSHGRYVAYNATNHYLPDVSSDSLILYDALKKAFPYASFCLYEGKWLSQLMHHVAVNNATYIEVGRDAAESVFEWMRSNGKEAYYRPDSEFLYRYVDFGKKIFIVKILTSQSPLMEVDGITVPTIEKLLVDIFCDKDFTYLQGAEYYHIMNAAQNLYPLNEKSLLRYASRRNVKEKIEKIMEESQNDID